MRAHESLSRLRAALLKPPEWEKDDKYRAAVDQLTGRGLFAAGVLAVLAVALYLIVNLLFLGKEARLSFPSPTDLKVYVVLWDKLLVATGGVLLILLSRFTSGSTIGRWAGMALVVAASAASVFDDVQGGDVGFSPVYPTLFMLVAVGTLMLRPLQTLGLSVVVSLIVFFGESFFASPGLAPPGIVREQLPFMIIVTIVLTGISLLLYTTRYEQYQARVRAEALEHEIAKYAGDLEKKARALEQEKLRSEEHALALEIEQARTKEHAHRLEEAEKLKNRFFANISHEFRTPLTLILGPLRDAIDGEYGDLPPLLNAQLPAIRSSGERLLRLVNDLLDVSRLEAGAVQIHPAVRDIVDFLRPLMRAFADLAARRNISLTLESRFDHLEVSFDHDAIEKVVYNLLSNGLKFTPAGGSVRVQLYTDKRGLEDMVCLAVRDTGPGIPAHEIEKVFDRFHQVPDMGQQIHEGTGLGLALVRELIELHGGEARAVSEVGFGSEFTICWPSTHRIAASTLPPFREIVHAESVEDQDEAIRGDGATSGRAPLILVVDDDADVRAYIRGRLQSSYRISEARDGLDAFEQIASERPALIICDVMMPRLDGTEFCSRLRRDPELADLPIILLTARADEDSRLEGLQAGADDYMSKPFSSSELVARVENLIEIRRMLRGRSTTGVVEPTPIDVQSVDQIFIDQVKAVVEDHIGDSNFGVDWLADEVALSTRQLQRRIKKLTRLSAAGYIRLMRLKRAALLLEKRAGNVSEIAYAVGFRDSAHFSKLFRQTFGALPSEVLEGSGTDDNPSE